jgi:hypothetical protein
MSRNANAYGLSHSVTRARVEVLDREDHEDHEDPEDLTSTRDDGFTGRVEGLADSILASLGLESDASRLSAVTLTSRPTSGSIRFSAKRFARTIEESGGGSLLIRDRGKHGVDHLHGLLVADRGVDAIGMWREIAHGAGNAQRCKTITGWRRYVEDGDVGLLDENLPRVLRYALKDPESGSRTLARDSWASGPLVEPWRAFVASEASRAIEAPKGPQRGEEALARGVDERLCAWCEGPIPEGKRADAICCRAGCRVSLCRSRKDGGITVPRITVRELTLEELSATGGAS